MLTQRAARHTCLLHANSHVAQNIAVFFARVPTGKCNVPVPMAPAGAQLGGTSVQTLPASFIGVAAAVYAGKY